MKVANVVLDPSAGGQFLVLLADGEHKTLLPIRIGPFEAQAISMKLANEKPARPITYDLLKFILESLEAKVSRILINALKEGIFFAQITLRTADGATMELDSRPSDAIALALRVEAPIYVANDVLQTAGVSIPLIEKQIKDGKPVTDELLQEIDRPGSQEDTAKRIIALKAKLQQAIEEEKYEEAARIRDEIGRLKSEGS